MTDDKKNNIFSLVPTVSDAEHEAYLKEIHDSAKEWLTENLKGKQEVMIILSDGTNVDCAFYIQVSNLPLCVGLLEMYKTTLIAENFDCEIE